MSPSADRPVEEERIYPCDLCSTMRTKAEGGTTFTVCEACWEKLYPRRPVENSPKYCGECKKGWREDAWGEPYLCRCTSGSVENSELREALTNLEQALTDRERSEFPEDVYSPAEAEADKGIAAARSRLEGLFASLQQDKDFQELRATKHLATVIQFGDEISRLRSDQITPEEAKALIWWSEDNTPFTEEEHSAMLKLSRISEGTPQ